MRRRSLPRLLALALVGMAFGCTTFVPVLPRPGAGQPELEIRFATPVRLVAARDGGEEVVMRNVTGIAGRALDVRGDTIVLQVTRWQSVGAWGKASPPVVATVVASDACTDIGTQRYSKGRTAAAILGPPVLAYLLFAIGCAAAPLGCF